MGPGRCGACREVAGYLDRLASRADALVSALERLDGSDQEAAQIAAEAALKGTTGLDLDSLAKTHSLSFCNVHFYGLELLCLIQAALQRVSTCADSRADFSGVWIAAQMMFAARKKQ